MGVLQSYQFSVTPVYFFKVQDTGGGLGRACMCVHSVCALKSKWDHAKHAVLQLSFLLYLRNIPISTDGVSFFPPVIGKCSMLWMYHNFVILVHITVFCER